MSSLTNLFPPQAQEICTFEKAIQYRVPNQQSSDTSSSSSGNDTSNGGDGSGGSVDSALVGAGISVQGSGGALGLVSGPPVKARGLQHFGRRHLNIKRADFTCTCFHPMPCVPPDFNNFLFSRKMI